MNGRIVLVLGVLGASWLGAGCGNDVKNGAVRLTIRYAGFVPGCVRVRAEDAAASQKYDEQTLTPADTTFDGELVVAVYRQESWSRDLKLVVTAHEQGCSGAAVASQIASATVTPGKIATASAQLAATDADADGWVSPASGGTDCDDDAAARYPGATEVCNTVDDDCDGTVDDGALPSSTWTDGDGDGFGTGTPILECSPSAGRASQDGDCNDGDGLIYPGAPERCNALDDDCDGQTNDGVAYFATYLDGDGDGFGAGASTSECAVPPGRSRDAGDCNDAEPQTYPGAPERCDTFDNDCDSQPDETFALGTTCATGKTCSGEVACAVDGGTRCSELPLTWYVDFDRDTHGALDAGTTSACDPPAGHVAAATDCDDGDPFTFVAANELCDRKDNDCDTIVDESACGAGDGGWKGTLVGDNSNEWKTVTAVDAGWWWMGGRDSAISPPTVSSDLAEIVSGTVTDRFDLCKPAAEWSASWAMQEAADDSMVIVGGCAADGGTGTCKHGVLAMAKTKTASCLVFRHAPSPIAQVTGVVGIKEPAGLRVFAVGGSTAYEAHPTTLNPVGTPSTVPGTLYDVHGASFSTVYAVGLTAVGNDPLVLRYDESGTSPAWIPEPGVVALAPSQSGALLGVWVVNADLVYAVGEGGMVLRKVRGVWSAMTDVPGGVDVRSVRAFGHNSVYVAAGSEAYRWNGTAWEHVYNGGDPMTDIAGVRPDQLVMVGENGVVVYAYSPP